MEAQTLMKTLRADLARYWEKDRSAPKNLQYLILTQGVWATVVLRLGQWLYQRPRPLIGVPGKIAYQLASKLVEVTTGIQVPASTKIGDGLYIGHFGTIIVHPDTVMGENCSIGQGVTIGTRGQGASGVPVFGDSVYIGAGAKVLGPVHIGDSAAIGANAVIVKDVPAGAVAVGIPGKIIAKRTAEGS